MRRPSSAFRTAISVMRQRRPGAPPSAPPTPSSWTGPTEEPPTTAATTDHLDNLCRLVPEIQTLQGRYYSRIHNLHGMCFYSGYCTEQTERRINETAAYIDDAQTLATG